MNILRNWPSRPFINGALTVLIGGSIVFIPFLSSSGGEIGGTLTVRVKVVESCDVRVNRDGDTHSGCGTALRSSSVASRAQTNGSAVSSSDREADGQIITFTY